MKKMFYLAVIVTMLAGVVPVRAQASIITVENTDGAITYSGSWSTESYGGYHGGSATYSNTTDNYYSYTFTGSAVTVYGNKQSNQGIIEWFVDDVSQGTVDNYNASANYQQQLFTWSGDYGTHTVKVNVTGTKNSSSSNYYATLDYLTYDETDPGAPVPLIEYTSWNPTWADYYDFEITSYDNDCTQVSIYTIRCTGNFEGTDTHDSYDGHQTIDVYISVPAGATVYYTPIQIDNCAVGVACHPEAPSLSMYETMNCENPVNGVGQATSGAVCVEDSASGVLNKVELVFNVGYLAGTVLTGQWDFFLSVNPPCNELYASVTSNSYELDPTLETPLGPEGTPPDQQIYQALTGEVYKLDLTGGPWNDGTTDRGVDITVSWDGSTWVPYASLTSQCVGGMYIEAQSDTLYFRVDDTAGNFADNINNPDPVTLTIEQQALLSTSCESQYAYGVDDLLAEVVVDSQVEAGIQVTGGLGIDPPQVEWGEWYAITVTSGTWQDEGSGAPLIDMEYKFDSNIPSASWADLTSGSKGIGCQSTDGMTWFVQAYDNNLWLRVNNVIGTFGANTGELNVSIYHAAYNRNPQACEYSYEIFGSPVRFEVMGDSVNGKSFAYVPDPSDPFANVHGNAGIAGQIPNQSASFTTRPLSPGAWYIIDTIEGPWFETTTMKNANYDMAVNDGNGWIPLEEWTVPVCNVALDALGHRRIYFQVPEGPLEWFFRVNSTTFGDNSGYLAWNLYRAGQVDLANPEFTPWAGCLDDHTNSADQIAFGNWIPVKDEAGTYIKGNLSGSVGTNGSQNSSTSSVILSTNFTYALVVTGGPWDDDEDDSTPGAQYGAAVSPDNGTTWYEINKDAPLADCISVDLRGRYWTYLFTVQEGQIWKVRVNDTTGDFANNGGNLSYALYHIRNLDPDTITGEAGIAANFCTDAIVRPSSLLDIPAWVDYAQTIIRRFFSWCPSHTDAVLAVINSMRSKEPFATVQEAVGVADDIKMEIDSYDWQGDPVDTSLFSVHSSADLNKYVNDHIFPTSRAANNPWEGGQVLDVSAFSRNYQYTSYYNTCKNVYSGYLPEGIAQGVCFVSGAFRDTGASFWIQLSFDISCFFLMIAATKRPLQEVIFMMTGVKPWTKSGANACLLYTSDAADE